MVIGLNPTIPLRPLADVVLKLTATLSQKHFVSGAKLPETKIQMAIPFALRDIGPNGSQCLSVHLGGISAESVVLPEGPIEALTE